MSSRDPLGLSNAEVSRLEDRAQHALGRDRVSVDVVPVGRHHTAEILRPWAVGGSFDDYVAGTPGAQLLRLGREPEEGIDLSLGEELERSERRVGDPTDVPGGIEPDLGGHQGQQRSGSRLEADTLAFQIGDIVDAFPSEQFEATDMHAAEHDNR